MDGQVVVECLKDSNVDAMRNMRLLNYVSVP